MQGMMLVGSPSRKVWRLWRYASDICWRMEETEYRFRVKTLVFPSGEKSADVIRGYWKEGLCHGIGR
jgi:hypothetical protein